MSRYVMPKSGPGWLFVYGTLRPHRDAYNSGMLRGEVDKMIRNATAPGTIHYVHRTGGFPVAFFDSDSDSVIMGDLLHVEDMASGAVQRVHRMEIGAGYRMVDVEVTTPEGETITATAYHYEHEPQGPRIACGDWLAAELARG